MSKNFNNNDKPSFFEKLGKGIKKVFKTLARWGKRFFFGASKEFDDVDVFNVEKIESPMRVMVKSYFERKVAVIALFLFVAMLLFVFIMPAFVHFEENYQDSNQSNIAPNFDMLNVSKEVKKDFKDISSYSTFSVGLTGSGKVSIWGHTLLGASKIDVADIPEAVLNSKIEFVAAGRDHIIAIDDQGNVYGWGNPNNRQYGEKSDMPTKVDIANVKDLVCGNQISAIVMKDGSHYMWGNENSVSNMKHFADIKDISQIGFMSSVAVAVLNDGSFTTGSLKSLESVNGQPNSNLASYLKDKKIIQMANTASTTAFLLSSGEIVVSGNFNFGENKLPTLAAGEKFTAVKGGNRNFVATTDKGNVFSWGSDYLGQSDVPKRIKDFDDIEVGPFQTYLIKDGEVVQSWGLKGYLFGTDNLGRDVFARIVHGGKMTMTVGAVAVIVSSLIAIIIGCISGYFGGWVDLLLMRITEIFASIPFLPFALLLSLVLRTAAISETMRIFMIMVVLGFLSWTGLARMIRGQVLAEREKEFVVAAKSMGVKETKIAFKHILPNVFSVVLVTMTLDFATCMLTESSLSYLGFGVLPPKPTWGNMLTGSNNSIVIQTYWWRWVFPAIFLAFSTICINLIGDALRDVLDPKSSSER